MGFELLPTVKHQQAWMSAFVIPFLNVKSDKERYDFYFEFCMTELREEEIREIDFQANQSEEYRQKRLEAGGKDIPIGFHSDRSKKIFLEEVRKPDFVGRLKDLWLLVFNMVRIPLLSRRGEAIPDETIKAIPNIESKIGALINEKPLKVYYKGFGCIYNNYEENEMNFAFSHLEKVESKCVYAIYASFFSLPDDEEYLGPGYNKYGLCPNCGVFFEKKRKDQEYCSEKCRKAAQNRRLYNSKK